MFVWREVKNNKSNKMCTLTIVIDTAVNIGIKIKNIGYTRSKGLTLIYRFGDQRLTRKQPSISIYVIQEH